MTAPAPAFDSHSRSQSLQRLRQETFDVLILGGGINGAGIARDLALRARRKGHQLRIGLIEQRQFGSGTSGRNSQLLHGGLRYLENLEFGLVREALHERATLRGIAPHLVDPLPFLIPFYGWFERRYYGTGLWLYDLLAGSRNIARRRYLSREDLAQAEPRLDMSGLHSAAIYHDCRVNAARFLLENIFDAARDGAAIANYTRADKHEQSNGGHAVEARDMLSGDFFRVRAMKLVDARGPWDDGGSLRLVRGSHIILPRVNASPNAIAHFAADGRIIFIIPWGPGERLSLVGTTDVDHAGGPDDVRITADEVRYLQGIVAGLFPAAAGQEPISTYSSLRPLLKTSGSATAASRGHRIWNDDEGVLRIAGGKYTTYRAMSDEATSLVVQEIAPELTDRCATGETPLGGNTGEALEELTAQTPALAARHGLEATEVKQLVRAYGVQTPRVLELMPPRPEDGLSRIECAIIAFAARHEMAQRLPDVLYVSTYWGYQRHWEPEDLARVARRLGCHLGWDEARVAQEAELALRIGSAAAADTRQSQPARS